jgi:hypothetical protein
MHAAVCGCSERSKTAAGTSDRCKRSPRLRHMRVPLTSTAAHFRNVAAAAATTGGQFGPAGSLLLLLSAAKLPGRGVARLQRVAIVARARAPLQALQAAVQHGLRGRARALLHHLGRRVVLQPHALLRGAHLRERGAVRLRGDAESGLRRGSGAGTPRTPHAARACWLCYSGARCRPPAIAHAAGLCGRPGGARAAHRQAAGARVEQAAEERPRIVAARDVQLRVAHAEHAPPGQQEGRLLVAEHERGHVDQLLQRAPLLHVRAARPGLQAAAHEPAAGVDVHGRRVLVRQAQRVLERADAVRLVAPAPPRRARRWHPRSRAGAMPKCRGSIRGRSGASPGRGFCACVQRLGWRAL